MTRHYRNLQSRVHHDMKKEARELERRRDIDNLPSDAFADDDPEALKQDHRKYYHKPTDIGAARSALDDAGYSEDR